MDSREQGKLDAANEGYPIRMDSQYCEEYLKNHDNCESCEYSFSCHEILKMTLRNSVKMVRDYLVEAGERVGEINSEECKSYRLIHNKCDDCMHSDSCYIEALKVFHDMKGLE